MARWRSTRRYSSPVRRIALHRSDSHLTVSAAGGLLITCNDELCANGFYSESELSPTQQGGVLAQPPAFVVQETSGCAMTMRRLAC